MSFGKVWDLLVNSSDTVDETALQESCHLHVYQGKLMLEAVGGHSIRGSHKLLLLILALELNVDINVFGDSLKTVRAFHIE